MHFKKKKILPKKLLTIIVLISYLWIKRNQYNGWYKATKLKIYCKHFQVLGKLYFDKDIGALSPMFSEFHE